MSEAPNQMPYTEAVRTAQLWKAGRDTLYIAQLLRVPESVAQRFLADAKKFGLVA